MSERWRLFLALPVPAHIRSTLWDNLAGYRVAQPNVRWLDRASWHVTLVFLGMVPARRVEELVAQIADVARHQEAIELSVDGGDGRSEGGKDGVAWLRIGQGAGAVIDLASELHTRSDSSLGAPVSPRRTPAAHLTVARKAGADTISALRSQQHGPIAGEWSADRIALMRSHLSPDGARYETLCEARCTLPSSDI